MTYYLYDKGNRQPCALDYKIPVCPPEWKLVRESEQPFHIEGMVFDADGKLVLDLQALRFAKKAEVDTELRARAAQDAEYDGTVLDADANAVEALKAKLVELDVRTPPVDQLFWRDTNNVHRHFDNVDDYRAFLAGALGIILARNAEDQAWAFATKNQIAAMQNPMALTSLRVGRAAPAIPRAAATIGPAGEHAKPAAPHPEAVPPGGDPAPEPEPPLAAPPESVAEPDPQG
jgi:hypothetical protein